MASISDNPEKMKEWSLKNTLNPATIPEGSSKKVWWKCKHGHDWEATAGSRTKNNTGCPYCSGRLPIAGETDLVTTHPEIAAQWSDRNEKPAIKYKAGSEYKAWWICKHGHEWKTTIYSRKIGQGCPYCSGRLPIIGKTDLATTHPEIAAQWSPENTKKSQETASYANIKALWECNKGHKWKATVYNRTTAGHGCPYCSGRLPIAGETDLATTHPKLTLEWSPKNKTLPQETKAGSHKKVKWNCNKKHEWQATIKSRAITGNGCPYCSGLKPIQGETDLATTHPHLIKEWHPDNKTQPQQYSRGSEKRIKWICEKQHEWETQISVRAKGHKCPTCKAFGTSKEEKQIAQYIKSLGFNIETSNRKIIRPQELDIYIPNKNIAIEYNGLYWHSEKYKNKNYHHDKWLKCRKQNIELIQIWEDEWRDKRKIVETMLAHKLDTEKETYLCADKTFIKKISVKNSNIFFDKHHIKGKTKGTLCLGLYYKKELIAATLFTQHPKNTWELTRYATTTQTTKPFNQLLTHFEQTQKWAKITAYTDLSFDDNKTYQNNGFITEQILKPDYTYASRQTGWKRIPKTEYENKPKPKNLLHVYNAGTCKRIKTHPAAVSHLPPTS